VRVVSAAVDVPVGATASMSSIRLLTTAPRLTRATSPPRPPSGFLRGPGNEASSHRPPLTTNCRERTLLAPLHRRRRGRWAAVAHVRGRPPPPPQSLPRRRPSAPYAPTSFSPARRRSSTGAGRRAAAGSRCRRGRPSEFCRHGHRRGRRCSGAGGSPLLRPVSRRCRFEGCRCADC